jgi:hypothetical protein
LLSVVFRALVFDADLKAGRIFARANPTHNVTGLAAARKQHPCAARADR